MNSKDENTESNSVNANTCETGGSCLTGSRMCPGFAMMGGFIVGQLLYIPFSSEILSWSVGILVSLALFTGLHIRIWKKCFGK